MDLFPYRLMAPGPVQLAPEVLTALSEPMIHHRTPDFEQILKRVLQKLPPIFGTSQPVLMHTSTGSGAMESAVVNTLSPGDEVLVIVSGKFGERWAEIAQAYGLQVHKLDVEWGLPVHPSDVQAQLKAHPKIKAVFSQACETSTGTRHPIKELSQVIHQSSSAIFIVDAITAIGAEDLKMDEWNLDVVIAGSQKAFMIPTGLSFIALSQRAWEMTKTAKIPRHYWDLQKELKANQKGETFFSSPVSLIKALDKVLWRFENDGLKKLIHRSQLHASVVRKVCTEIYNMPVFSLSPANALTAVRIPQGTDGQILRDHLEKKYNLTVMGGQDHLKGQIIRIGHLGYIKNDDVVATIHTLGLSLADLNAPGFTPVTVDNAVRATENLLRADGPSWE